MSDTQLPLYIVFDQPAEGKPAQYAGAVHAPDPEMALLNARDVFARRDDHVYLWVVRDSAIYAKTAEELTESANQPASPLTEQPTPSSTPFLVFQKTVHKGTLVQVGEVNADDPVEAMTQATAAYPNPKAIVWWVLPASAIYRTDPAENDTLFGPAHEKHYRHSSFYPTVTLMREINLANEKLDWKDE
ncbi:MAG: phenylacetic acid degradation protein [Anaerolineales bacterium]|nr:phenylacetic acid degradation protein [Anaerolineales bacterium]